MSQPLISVIIPIYKSEKYIDRCLKSLLNQTYKNLEIVMVNDASPDKSGELCEQYAQQHDNIKVIHNATNGGSCVARNVGLDHATGDYIGFVDPDDEATNDIFEKFYDFSSQNECDIVICGRYEVFQKKPLKKVLYTEKNMMMEKNKVMQMLFNDTLASLVFDKFFKKELWDGIRFVPGKVFADDICIMHHIFDRAQRIGFIAEALYYYYINDSSLSNSYRPFKWVDTYLTFKERLEFAEKKYPGMTNGLKAITLDFARLSLDNYFIKREKCDEPYIPEIVEFMIKGKHLVKKLPEMKWKNKMMIRYYHFSPKLYEKTIRIIHWLFYSFYPNSWKNA